MKKFYLSVLATMFASSVSMAQLSAVDYKSDEFAKFKASKTYGVKTGDAAYDAALESTLKDIWKITSYEMLEAKDLKTKITDATASFILSIVIETGKSNQNYHYIALINGGKKNIDRYSYDDMIAYGVINHWGNEINNTDCAFRLRNILESMVDALNITQKNDIKGNSKKIVDGLRDHYNGKASKIKERTLLVPSYVLSGKLNKADIGGLYPFKYEVCDKAKVEQAIKDKSKDYYYLQPGITLNKSIFVFDPSNGEVVYFDYAIMGMFIKKSDIEDMVATIKGDKK